MNNLNAMRSLCLRAGHLIADKGYDSDAIVEQAQRQGMEPVIPPRRNRKVPREYDSYLYRLRHLVENAFLHLKRWRGIAPATPKTPPLSSPQSKSDASPFGLISRDYTIYGNADLIVRHAKG